MTRAAHKHDSPVAAGLVVKISKSAASIIASCDRFVTFERVLYAMAFELAACVVLVACGGAV